MSQNDHYSSYATCITEILSASPQPMSVDTILSSLAEMRPVGKGARSAVYRALGNLFQAVPVAPARFGWLSHLLAGATFRHPLTSEEIRRGFVLLDELEHLLFFPQFFQTNRPDDRVVQIELFGGPVIEAEASIERKTWSLQMGEKFTEWVDAHGGQNKDNLLIRVVDAVEGRYEIRLNLQEMRDERLIHRRNIKLALIAEEIVSDDRRMRKAIPTCELAARLIGQGFFHEQPATDDFHFVLHEYSMLKYHEGDGYQLQVADEDDASQELQVVFADANDLGLRQDSKTHGSSNHSSWHANESLFGDSSDDSGEYHDTDGNGYPELGPAENCAVYQAYLSALEQMQSTKEPLSHEDFHLLESELEMLVRLEDDFGRLMPEQNRRKSHLADLLFIDPDEFLGNDWPGYDGPADDNSPFWTN